MGDQLQMELRLIVERHKEDTQFLERLLFAAQSLERVQRELSASTPA